MFPTKGREMLILGGRERPSVACMTRDTVTISDHTADGEGTDTMLALSAAPNDPSPAMRTPEPRVWRDLTGPPSPPALAPGLEHRTA